MKHPKTWLKAGIIGSVVVALCCFTPVLVILFAVVGLSAWVGYLDYVLFPALFAFITLTVVAYLRVRSARAPCIRHSTGETE